MHSRPSLRPRRLNARMVALIAVLIVPLSAGLVFGLGHRSVFVELQITLLVLAASLFCFLSAGLYWGLRLDPQPRRGAFGGFDNALATPSVELPSMGDWGDVGGGDDPISMVLAIIGWIIVSVVLIIALVMFASVLWGVLLALLGALFWLFAQALRQVFVHARRCRGNVLLSTGYALWFTLLYTGWLLGLSWLARFLLT
jgi:hypothetical protein